MNLTVINFSDIHFTEGKNSILKKKEKLIRALKSYIKLDDDSKILFIISGDIVFSGKKEEYDLASDFFADIISSFNNADLLSIPGNHDCDFSNEDDDVRNILIQKITETSDKRKSRIDKVLLQKNFNEHFLLFKEFWKHSTMIHDELLFKTIDFSISETKHLRINLINTSWDSKINEKPGTMFMPIPELSNLKYKKDALLNISVLHHPTHWLEPNNKREFDHILEDGSDIILTGHEHQGNTISKRSHLGESIMIEGNVLQENSSDDISRFNIISFNTDKSIVETISLKQMRWDSAQQLYTSSNTNVIKVNTMIRKVNHIEDGETNLFLLNDRMKRYLNELGAPLYHPVLGQLNLNDIYVYPDFNNTFEDKNKKRDVKIDNLLNDMYKQPKVWFIEGDKESGKTTLMKKLFLDFFDNNFTPLIIDAKTIKDARALKKLTSTIQKNVEDQYIGEVFNRFIQLDCNDRIILIDNWDLIGLNKAGKKELLKELNVLFDRIIIFTNSEPNNSTDILGLNDELGKNINFYQIKRFGFKKREELIEKWLRINNEYTLEEEDLIVEVDKYAKQVDEVIGKSFVPQVPVYMLIILQSMANGRDLTDFNNQSNGYYYELLIKQLITNIGINSNEMSMLHNYLSHFAYKIFSHKKKSLDYEEWNNFHNIYVENYELSKETMNFSKYTRKLLDSTLIQKFSNNRYTFSYNYALYFFTAQYLANNISEEIIKERIYDLINNINIDINANVLIFLTHLSKDDYILNTVIEISNQLLTDISELEMEEDIEELNQLMNELPTLVFKNTAVKENRRHYNEVRDSNNDEEKHFLDDNSIETKEAIGNSQKDDPSLVEKNSLLIEMDKAQRISEVIGQVLKNYSGSILGETKRELLESAYNVSLRGGSKLIEIVKSEKNELVSFISEKIIEDGVIETTDQNEVEKASKRIVFRFVEMICFSVIQKCIKDTGSGALKVSYDNLISSDLSMVKKLIISGSYLETMYVNPSDSYLSEVFENTNKNLLAKSILQQMVAKYMYLFELPFHQRQKIADNFKIKYDPVVKAKIDRK